MRQKHIEKKRHSWYAQSVLTTVLPGALPITCLEMIFLLTLKEALTPVWDTDIVYGESFTFVRDESGKAFAPFLYPPQKILSATNATLTESYEEGRDFRIENDCIYLTENSRIFAFTEKELFYEEPYDPEKHFPYPNGNLLYGKGDFFHQRQVCVTYTCEKGGWTGHIPTIAADKLTRTFQKLRNGEKFTAVIFGDSISAGANSSKNSNVPPHQDPYAGLFIEGLRQHFNCPITYHNPSVGGKDSVWAKENTEELVCMHNPDFVVIAFGMNDGGKDPQIFANNIRSIVEQVRAKNAEAELLLIATSTPNPILTDERAKFNNGQERFKEALEALVQELGDGIALANIRDMQAFLHSKKRFIDTTGNHVNHPNDFFYRLYAQYLCGMFY